MRRALTPLLFVSLACGGGQTTPEAVDATKSTVVITKQTARADDNEDVQATVTLLSKDGKPVSKQAIEVAVSGTGNIASLSGSSDQSGVVVVTMRSSVAEEKTVSVNAGGVTLDAKPKVTFVPGPIQALTFSTQPGATRVGQVITPAVFVTAADSKGNLVKDSDVTVSVRLVRSTGGVVMNGGAKAITDGGVRFDMLTIDRAQTGYALRAEASNGYQVESNTFDVTP
ncbi:MAG: Ig-like domain-containing protein [Myxococcaceae bacterium]